MKEYKCIRIKTVPIQTEELLNKHAKEGWEVLCVYATGNWLILERDIK